MSAPGGIEAVAANFVGRARLFFRHRFEHSESRWHWQPLRSVAGKQRDGRVEERGLRGPLAAIAAEAIALVRGVAPRVIPNRAAEAPADIGLRATHLRMLARCRGKHHCGAGFAAGAAHRARSLDIQWPAIADATTDAITPVATAART